MEDQYNDHIEERNKDNQYLLKEGRITRDHLIENMIGDISKGVTTRHSLTKYVIL